jgi:hypothetical protein
LDAVDELDALIARQDDKRFPPVAANVRGWLLRGAGLLDQARELHEFAAGFDPGPTFQEARYAGLLDLAECHLADQNPDQAAVVVGTASAVLDWTGSMSWRHRNRYQLLADRLASLAGDHADAAADARSVAAAAAERGDRRYQYRGLLVAALAESRSGVDIDRDALRQLVEAFVPLSGPDGWRDLAELAAVTGSMEIWQRAEKQAGVIVAEASVRSDVGDSNIGDAIRRQLDWFKP